MEAIPGPSHGIHSRNVSERNRIEEESEEWNEILLILDMVERAGDGGGRRKDRNLSGAELLRELQNRNYDNTGHCPIHTNLLARSVVRATLEGWLFLSNFMMMTKKYWKNICSHIKNVKGPLAHARRLLMEVILMHWVTFISHITGNEYHGAQVFRSIPNCIYVLEVIGLPTPDEGAEITSERAIHSTQWPFSGKLSREVHRHLLPHPFVVLTSNSELWTRKLPLFMRARSAALHSHVTRDLHGKVFCVMRNKSMHEITRELF